MTRQMRVDSQVLCLGSLSPRHNATTTIRTHARSRAMDDVAVLKFKNQQLGGQVRAMERTNERTNDEDDDDAREMELKIRERISECI